MHGQNILEMGLKNLKDLLKAAGIDEELSSTDCPSGYSAAYSLPREHVTFMVDVKPSLYPHQVSQLLERYRQQPRIMKPGWDQRLLILTSYLTKSALDRCAESGVCALAENGNGYIQFARFLYEKFVPQKAPERSSQGSIFSAKASRLVRAMLARYPEPWNQSDLARSIGVSPGYVSTLVSEMLDADYIRRGQDKLRVVDPNRLLDDWSSRYRFDRHKRSRFAMSMGEYLQGLRKFQQEMRRQSMRFAFTGWSAAYLKATYGMPDSIVAYVDRLTMDIPFQAFHPVENQGNVLLLLPHDEGVFQFTDTGEFGETVADVQCYLDLMGLPGRASEQAEILREKRLTFEVANGQG